MRVVLIGMPLEGPSRLGTTEREAIEAAEVVAAGERHLEDLSGFLGGTATRIVLKAPLATALDGIETAARSGASVVVIGSGDPGMFGIGRALAERLGPSSVAVSPSASSVSVAFGRLGLPLDDALVVSAHGRPTRDAVGAALTADKVAILTSPESPPEQLGALLLDAAHPAEHVAVASHLGAADETVVTGDLAWLAAGRFPPRSVVILWRGDGVAAR
ncbi:MAG: precorrin-6y C5,15-methyltransferase (decarboxylating) subunit CbiE, partial [Acidimicrobiales bacterium]